MAEGLLPSWEATHITGEGDTDLKSDLCDRLADWAIHYSWDAVSTSARAATRRLLLDTLGCALGARDHPAVRQAHTVARALGGTPAMATGLGSGEPLSTLPAILDSATAIRALDFNDFYWSTGQGGHPSDVFASAIAVAEETGATLGQMLTAVVAGYEFYTRVIDLMRSDDPWDHTTACAIAGAAICGKLYKLDRAPFANAIAIAMARAPALSAMRTGKISSVKAAAPALSQIDAYLATQLAMAGMSGPQDAIFGPRGLRGIVVPGADFEQLVPSCSKRERVLDITIKRFPCMGTAQASTAAALELHEKLVSRLAEIETITLHLADASIVRRQVAEVYRRPDQRETADHSFYSSFAMMLVDGRLDAEQFASGRWKAPDIASVVDKMTLVADLPGAEEGIYPAVARVRLYDGAEIVVNMPVATGHWRKPLDDVGVATKFRSLAEPRLGPMRCDLVVKACNADDHFPVKDLIALTCRAEMQ